MLLARKFAVAAVASLTFIGLVSRASATVIPIGTFSPDSVSVGETVELDLRLNLFTDFGFIGPALFQGGSVTIFSGEAGSTSNTFAITPGVHVQDVTADVSYSQPGDYTPSFTIHATYTEKLLQFTCQHVPGCQVSVQTVTKNFNFTGLFFDPSSSNLHELIFDHDVVVTAAVPEPSTWLMMILGFAAIGFLTRRRSTRAKLALAN
jgi:hypothetical protein